VLAESSGQSAGKITRGALEGVPVGPGNRDFLGLKLKLKPTRPISGTLGPVGREESSRIICYGRVGHEDRGTGILYYIGYMSGNKLHTRMV
jgi:hypothetical protein